MKTSIIFHGVYDDKEEFLDQNHPSASNDHWLPWLQKQLAINGFNAQTPEIPYSYWPEYAHHYSSWEKELERYEVAQDSILIGHSCGGGFLVRYLSEHEVSANKLILVAPWFDHEQRQNDGFFDFKINPDLQNRVNEIHVLFSNNEEDQDVRNTVDEIMNTLPRAKLHKFDNMGHFVFGEMGRNEFPELLEIVLK